MTCGNPSEHSTLFNCCSPFWLTVCWYSWVIDYISSRAMFHCHSVSGLERVNRLDAQRVSCPYLSSPPHKHSVCPLCIAQRHHCEQGHGECKWVDSTNAIWHYFGVQPNDKVELAIHDRDVSKICLKGAKVWDGNTSNVFPSQNQSPATCHIIFLAVWKLWHALSASH